MRELYEMIFKRKSFRRFNETLSITDDQLTDICNKIESLHCIDEGIKVNYKIVRRGETTCKRGDYCLLIYSEKKPRYLQNIGYMFEQLDLYLASKNIGVCWYGMGKTDCGEYRGLDFVIMMAIGKGLETDFRKDYVKSKRKETAAIWQGNSGFNIAEIVKYAPSSCNTQPWFVTCENNNLNVYRIEGGKSIMPKEKIHYYNSIDMGIFLCILEITLMRKNYKFSRILCDGSMDSSGRMKIAEYAFSK